MFNKWSERVWLVHADSVFQYERVRMRRVYNMKLLAEQQRSHAQSRAVTMAKQQANAPRAKEAYDSDDDSDDGGKKKGFRMPPSRRPSH